MSLIIPSVPAYASLIMDSRGVLELEIMASSEMKVEIPYEQKEDEGGNNDERH